MVKKKRKKKKKKKKKKEEYMLSLFFLNIPIMEIKKFFLPFPCFVFVFCFVLFCFVFVFLFLLNLNRHLEEGVVENTSGFIVTHDLLSDFWVDDPPLQHTTGHPEFLFAVGRESICHQRN